MSDTDWILDANCKGTNTRVFFIYREDKNQRQRREAAYQVCRECLVRQECLDYAIVNNEIGIWGGTTDKDRRLLRRHSGGNYRKITNASGFNRRRQLRDYSPNK